jgi:hypothetical protein
VFFAVPFNDEGEFTLPSVSDSVQVKELGRHRKEAALYLLTFPDGHQVWRIAKPIHHHNQIPTTLWPEFTSETNARHSFARLVGWTTNDQ